jgi:hypothetical protein
MPKKARASMLTKSEIDRRAKSCGLKPTDELREFARNIFLFGLRTAHADAVMACTSIEAEISLNIKKGGV